MVPSGLSKLVGEPLGDSPGSDIQWVALMLLFVRADYAWRA
jgi:hypothetical protein